MSATVSPFWEGMDEEQLFYGCPGFYNDHGPWYAFICNCLGNANLIRTFDQLEIKALLTNFQDDMTLNEIMWVTPQELRAAAKRLYRLLKDQDKAALSLLDAYDEIFDDMEWSFESLKRDLKDVGKIADYVKDLGVSIMTMTYAP